MVPQECGHWDKMKLVLCTNMAEETSQFLTMYSKEQCRKRVFSCSPFTLSQLVPEVDMICVQHCTPHFLYEQEERPACYNYSLSQMCKFYNILQAQLLTPQFFLKLVIGSGSRKVLEATFDSLIFRHCSQQLLFTYSV